MSDMLETLRKMGLFGIGVISLTQEKLDEFTQDMVKRGDMSREEGKKFVRDVKLEKDRQLKEIEDSINQAIKETLERRGVATKSDIENLRARIEALEKNTLTRADTGDLEKKVEVLEKNTVMRVDVDILEGKIRELEQTVQSMTK